MAINYTIRAEVVDLRNDSPTPGDIFLVDTNIWYWITYPPASTSAQPYQIAHYPSYISSAVSVGSKLHYCGLTLAELTSLIERSEQRLSAYSTLKPKEYRHNYAAERRKVVREVQAAWGLVTASYSGQLDLVIDASTSNAAFNRFQTQLLDGYDLFLLETMQQQGITQIITDDGDYVTVPDIKVFSANQNVINAAASQGKLLAR
ncbi:PIN domain-containing protein [Leptolyngbya boryana CZ1]|uniref:PIN domain-containing protein n=1 Tax=Leptolyngbya boryana CZ1 TaxID=3060204 RepID=A0AA96WX50_LEPBY|nr:PIN domain-containing protein [Leptolyngbya boryana]WNZ47521.1 PIN domain-containing protein [Leptolyngbya boryana CZ1]